ncbi:T-complex protein 1 subunit theta [Camellia lanceoleosa]|uniref:T-complex protein 1 subunit theta n=1 Tax=Camellia lanceoleosa TaxID=1840588 RepID=A0ACC0ISZ5_9ERIC|nr:T-complex protein 1 subunit theta [Camellia lanceoleosa]
MSQRAATLPLPSTPILARRGASRLPFYATNQKMSITKTSLREGQRLMVLKISSKFELRRFCCTIGVVALVTIVRNEEGENSVCTVVQQGSSDSILDALERVVDDGVNTYMIIMTKPASGPRREQLVAEMDED